MNIVHHLDSDFIVFSCLGFPAGWIKQQAMDRLALFTLMFQIDTTSWHNSSGESMVDVDDRRNPERPQLITWEQRLPWGARYLLVNSDICQVPGLKKIQFSGKLGLKTWNHRVIYVIFGGWTLYFMDWSQWHTHSTRFKPGYHWFKMSIRKNIGLENKSL